MTHDQASASRASGITLDERLIIGLVLGLSTDGHRASDARWVLRRASDTFAPTSVEREYVRWRGF
jgi:hypothetical protein